MLFSLTNPEVAIFMMGLFSYSPCFLGFPIAFTLMAMGVGFGYYAYLRSNFEWNTIFDNRIFSIVCTKHIYCDG